MRVKAGCHLAGPIMQRSALARAPSAVRAFALEEDEMAQSKNDCVSHPWRNRKRAAALGFGLGTTLALTPLVWAEDPPVAGTLPQAPPQPMTSPVALMQ